MAKPEFTFLSAPGNSIADGTDCIIGCSSAPRRVLGVGGTKSRPAAATTLRGLRPISIRKRGEEKGEEREERGKYMNYLDRLFTKFCTGSALAGGRRRLLLMEGREGWRVRRGW